MNHPSEISIASVTEWLNQAVQDVSETMFSQAAYPAQDLEKSAATEDVLVACIGIRGNCQMEVALHFPKNLAAHLASLSLETPAAELDEKMVNDVAGEFSNMVVGAVKSRISDMEVVCAMTVPRVVRNATGAADLEQKIKAAMAVIRGSAGPRDPALSAPKHLAFHVGDGLLHLDVHL
jgi:CheY-specific phosphatase CheX